MLPTGKLFVRVYVLIDDLIAAGAIVIPPRWGPDPKCGDAELLTTATVRHLLGRRSEAGCLAGVARDWPGSPGTGRGRPGLAGVARDWPHLFPRLARQSQAIVPAAVNERDVAEDLLEAGPPPREKGNRYLASITGETAVAAAVRQGLQRRRLRPRADRPRHRGAIPGLRGARARCGNRRRG